MRSLRIVCSVSVLALCWPAFAQRVPEREKEKAAERARLKAGERVRARLKGRQAPSAAERRKVTEERAARRRSAPRGATPVPTPTPAPAPTPAPVAAVTPVVAAEQAMPGEKEFNECVKIPAHRRIKITLKQGSDLKDLVAWISSMTCKKFIVADTLRAQKVTLVSPTPVTAGEAYRAFLSSLEVMGLTVVPAGRFLKVVQGNWAIQSPIATYGENRRVPATDAVVTRLIQVENVDVNELLLVLNKMKSRSGDVTAYKPTNMLIITDGGLNVRRLVGLVKELDVEVEGEKIWVVRLKNADAEEVNKILSQIFGQRTASIPKLKGKAARPGGSGDTLSASKIVPDAASNSLIIVASPGAFAKIASLIKKLDVESDGADQKIHVYYLENADSEDLSTTLSGLTGGQVRTRGRGGRKAPARGQQKGGTTTLFEGDVKISADKATNSLVIVATTKDYLNLRHVIRRLDIPRRQVFVEATIMEISLDKSRKLGFAYHGGGLAGEGSTESIIFGGVQHSDWGSLVFNPLALMGLAVGARGAVIEGSAQLLGLPTDIAGFGVMFQAMQNNSNVNVLSSPHILTTDNEQAEITVGQNIPFQGAFVGGSLGGLAGGAAGQSALSSFLPTVSVQRQDVALKLKLTPHVNESDMVRLELEQEVSDIASQNFNGLGPSTSKRTAKTVVVVRDQQTVVIGGLMSDRVIDSVSKVPLLGDIPILGYFFKYSSKTKQKTNLLIVLTPYVIRDQSDLRRIFKRKLEERREFIERNTTFTHSEIRADVDYRHKRGLLSEINHVGIQAEQEAKLLDEARKQTEEPPEGVDMPRGLAPSSGTPSTISPVEPTGGSVDTTGRPPIHRPPMNPDRTIRLERNP